MRSLDGMVFSRRLWFARRQVHVPPRRRALDALQKAADANPDDPSYLLDVAQAAQTQGNLVAEIAAFQSFLTKAPDDPNAPTVRQQLKQALQQEAAQQVTQPASAP
jgi:regulator of sirC expression with transglutaminase-like and TPR domain